MIHLAVNFHYVGMPDLPYPGIHGVSGAEFERTISALLRDWTPVSLAQVLAAAEGDDALPAQSCLITFDDGLRGQYETARPILDRLDVPAAFFVPGSPYAEGRAATVHKLHWVRANLGDERVAEETDRLAAARNLAFRPRDIDPAEAAARYRYDTPETARLKTFLTYHAPDALTGELVDGLLEATGLDEAGFVRQCYMTKEMLCDLAARSMLGAHSMSHRPLALMPRAKAAAEIRDCRRLLEEKTGRRIAAFSYPLGNAGAVSLETAAAAQKAGFAVAYTMERAVNTDLRQPLLLARIDANDIPAADRLGDRANYRKRDTGTP